jgi:hypothetical protein
VNGDAVFRSILRHFDYRGRRAYHYRVGTTYRGDLRELNELNWMVGVGVAGVGLIVALLR